MNLLISLLPLVLVGVVAGLAGFVAYNLSIRWERREDRVSPEWLRRNR